MSPSHSGVALTTGPVGVSTVPQKSVTVGRACNVASKSAKQSTVSLVGAIARNGGVLDNVHIDNFLKCIREGGVPNADVEIGHKSTLWVQLGNISQRVDRSLNIDQRNGHIIDDAEAMKLWSRDYEPGWEVKV